jgi:hypothetical protein
LKPSGVFNGYFRRIRMAADYLDKRDADFDTRFSVMYRYAPQKCAGTPPARAHIPENDLNAGEKLHNAAALGFYRCPPEMPHFKMLPKGMDASFRKCYRS